MEARLLRAALLAALALSLLGAGRPLHSVRSQHFIVSAPTPQLAHEVCQAAEAYRRDLAIEWLGRELPPWRDICPITVKLDAGAGGATSFIFLGGMPTQWTMQIQGSRERILDSVLPHEITHTIFATHFGRPLPRWADEGGATTVEHSSEKAKQDRLLLQFLTTDRGIAFNNMFRMKEYPPDILPLYSQGYSLARYFIQQGGKQKYVEYIGEGLRTNDWPAATRKYYGFNSLSDLQLTWVEWVRQGSPDLATAPSLAGTVRDQPAASALMAGTQMASLTQQPRSRVPGGPLSSWQTAQAQNARAFGRGDELSPDAPVTRPAAPPAAASGADYSLVSRPVSDGWYARRRDQVQSGMQSSGANLPSVGAEPGTAAPTADRAAPRGAEHRMPPPPTRSAAPEAPLTPVAYHAPVEAESAGANPAATAAAPPRRVLLEWSRDSAAVGSPRGDFTSPSGAAGDTLFR